jgi:NAD(P)-dependent dehydrogenase (short-subunit alcohol dehydrogenase family)
MIHFEPQQRFLITGASSGLGRAIALQLSDLGATVIVLARTESKLISLKEETIHPENIIAVPFDLSNLDDIASMIKSLVATHGKLTGLVHSAGIGGVEPLKALSLESAKALFDLNYFAGLMLTKTFCDKRIYQANPSIVLLSSISSLSGNAGLSNYSASKGAINAMVRSVAVEHARNGIRINAVSPGFIVTDIIQHSPEVYNETFFEQIRQEYPLGEGYPNDIATMVSFLLSKQARWITGQNFVVDGGRTLL